MTWWAWVLLGLGLLGLEILTPGGFFVLFFGLAALVVGALAGLGLTGPAWLQWFLFSLLAVGSVVLFRRRLVERLRASGDAAVGSLVGDVAILLDDLAPGAVGKAELRGTAWSVRHDGPEPLVRGRRCRVERVEGLLLHVRPE
jgi:membrane protein implicated in regulation of membrane protease activity